MKKTKELIGQHGITFDNMVSIYCFLFYISNTSIYMMLIHKFHVLELQIEIIINVEVSSAKQNKNCKNPTYPFLVQLHSEIQAALHLDITRCPLKSNNFIDTVWLEIYLYFVLGRHFVTCT